MNRNEKKGNPIALLPIGVFFLLYLGMGLVFEYALKIEMGFYKIPIVVVFLAALLVAFLQNRKLSFDEKLSVVARSVGDKDIMTMVLIFLVAGIFVGVTGRSSAEPVAILWTDGNRVFLPCKYLMMYIRPHPYGCVRMHMESPTD